MSEIQRWATASVERDGEYSDPIYKSDIGPYVEYEDHEAREEELVRMLKEYHRQHQNLAQGYGKKDCGCVTCEAVDALEGR